MHQTWTKSKRLRKSVEFQHVQRKGHKWSSKDFLFLFCMKKKKQKIDTIRVSNISLQWRFGFVVSKKVGNAVVRNTIKRLLRENVRIELAQYSQQSSAVIKEIDVVIVAFTSACNIQFTDVQQQIQQAFSHITKNMSRNTP